MSNVIFSATKLPMLGKQGKQEPDSEGYYELIVGGLNTHNNTGAWFYTVEGCRELFRPGSILMRRIANGCLRAEVNHPKRKVGESDESFMGRMMDVDLNNVCAHFKELWLDEEFGKNHPEYNNPNLIAIMGKVKPSGAKSAVLKEALENPNENVCFSIRALADEGFQHGKRIRVLREMLAIDFVNEGGILIATKWDSPATESIGNDETMRVTEALFKRLATDTVQSTATESSREVASYIVENYFKPKITPIYEKW